MKTCGFILQQGTLEQETNKKPPSAHAWPRQGKVSAQKFVAIYCTENTKNKTDTHFSPLPPNSKKFERWSFKFRATYLKKRKKLKQTPKQIVTKKPARGVWQTHPLKGLPLKGDGRPVSGLVPYGHKPGRIHSWKCVHMLEPRSYLRPGFFASTGCFGGAQSFTFWWGWDLGHFVCQSSLHAAPGSHWYPVVHPDGLLTHRCGLPSGAISAWGRDLPLFLWHLERNRVDRRYVSK